MGPYEYQCDAREGPELLANVECCDHGLGRSCPLVSMVFSRQCARSQSGCCSRAAVSFSRQPVAIRPSLVAIYTYLPRARRKRTGSSCRAPFARTLPCAHPRFTGCDLADVVPSTVLRIAVID